ncbi:MAG: hypothetical protein JW910_14660 [Anaerolineae bacterium]|nr:hypothetical protein [Anaerolineae bacterium]
MRWQILVAGAILILAVLALGAALINRPLALPADAQNALDRYMPEEPPYHLRSVQQATTPENFAGVCSYFDAQGPGEMWCTHVTGGYSYASHFILHGNQQEDGVEWSIVPVFDFDQALFSDIGCTNW